MTDEGNTDDEDTGAGGIDISVDAVDEIATDATGSESATSGTEKDSSIGTSVGQSEELADDLDELPFDADPNGSRDSYAVHMQLEGIEEEYTPDELTEKLHATFDIEDEDSLETDSDVAGVFMTGFEPPDPELHNMEVQCQVCGDVELCEEMVAVFDAMNLCCEEHQYIESVERSYLCSHKCGMALQMMADFEPPTP